MYFPRLLEGALLGISSVLLFCPLRTLLRNIYVIGGIPLDFSYASRCREFNLHVVSRDYGLEGIECRPPQDDIISSNLKASRETIGEQDTLVRLMKSDFREPVNIESDEMVSMNEMAGIVLNFENKKL
ncbi:UNVERIFIED_CONTAM: GDP-mannose 3,5-epimerase 2 [Sesamum radiatum]|uniref:GDP-mannose 3,5-epimerase 2 n=1 Tax=Sesamum radiatum TaxID=300843 RepID=A0AAW2JC34_SESRA